MLDLLAFKSIVVYLQSIEEQVFEEGAEDPDYEDLEEEDFGEGNGRRRGRRQRGASGDFVNLEDLPARSSKMLIEARYGMNIGQGIAAGQVNLFSVTN
ncbi:hypothetical protein EJB05_46328, partial [Eragrostis curvula]